MIQLDHRLERWVVHHRTGWLDPVFRALTHAASQGLLWLLLALTLAYLWRRPTVFVYVLVADAVADLSSSALKAAIPRDRPPLRYPEPAPLVHVPSSHSFPSGHTATSFACAAMLASFKPRLGLPLFLLAAAVAYSRVYVGVHYPLDVLGGALLGVAVAALVRFTAPRLPAVTRLRSRRAPTAG